MPALRNYPSQQAAEFLDSYAGGKYGQPQSREGGGLRHKAERVIRDSTWIPSQPIYKKRTDPACWIAQSIEKSRHLLKLPDDWDGEGSQAISESTWNRASNFLKLLAERVYRNRGSGIDLPNIAPGPNGSIDLHWDFPQYELLVNFPADPNALAECYGDDRGRIRIKATFDQNTANEGLLMWLQRATTDAG